MEYIFEIDCVLLIIFTISYISTYGQKITLSKHVCIEVSEEGSYIKIKTTFNMVKFYFV